MPAPNPVRELIKREGLVRIPGASIHERIELYDPFVKRPVLQSSLDPSTINQAAVRLLTGANTAWAIEGTNAANAGSALNVNGGVLLSAAGADNDQIILRPAEAINSVAQSAWNTIEWEPEHEIRFECVIELPAITTIAVQAGFGLDPANLDLTSDDDKCVFQFSTEGATSTANWTACTSVGGTDVETDTTVAGEATKSIRLGISVSSTRTPRFYINGVQRVVGSSLTAGVNLIPYIGIQALAAAAKTVAVRYVRCSRLLNAS